MRTWGGVTTFLAGELSGSGDFIKTDSGPLILETSDNPDFTGKVVIGAGRLQFPDTLALGPEPAVPVPDFFVLDASGRITGGDGGGGTDLTIGANRGITINGGQSGFEALAGTTITVDAPIVNGNVLVDGGPEIQAGTLAFRGGGTTILNADASHNGETLLLGGTVDFRSEIVSTTNFALRGTSTAEIGPDAVINTQRFVTSDSGSAQSVVNQTGGQINISGGNNSATNLQSFFIGHWGAGGTSTAYNLSGGEINAPAAALSLGWDSASVNFNQTGGVVNAFGLNLGNGRNNPAAYHLDGGELNLGSFGITSASNKVVNLGGGTLGSTASWSTNHELLLTGTNGDAVFAPGSGTVIRLNGALTQPIDVLDPVGIVVNGAGTLALAGTADYAGATTVTSGTLQLNGGVSGTSPVTVQSGGIIATGTPDQPGGATVETLDLADGSSSSFRLDFGSPDQLVVTEADGLTVNGTHTIAFSLSGEVFPGDSFPVIEYDGNIGGDGFSAFSLSAPNNPHLDLQLVDNTLDGTVDISVVDIDTTTWTGAVDGIWDIDSSANWERDSNGVATNFYDFDTITFADGASTTDVTVVGAISQSGMTFINDNDIYTFSGDGIGGSGGLLMDGFSTVRLFNDNTYTGATQIDAGQLVIGDGTSGSISADSAVTIAEDAELVLNLAPATSFASPITFTGGTLTALGDQVISSTITNDTLPGVFNVGAGDSLTLSASGVSGDFEKLGEGLLTTLGSTGSFLVSEGTLRVTSAPGQPMDYTVSPNARMEVDYSQGFVYGRGIAVDGDGVASTNGLYLVAGRSINLQGNGGLRLRTAPSTVRTLGDGVSTMTGFDINTTHLTVEAEASGSIIDESVRLDGNSFGYRMNIISGSDTATGDLIVNSPLITGGGGGVTRDGVPVAFQKWGSGSILFNAQSTLDRGFWLREGTVILGDDNIFSSNVNLVFGDGTASGTLDLNGHDQTLQSVRRHNNNTGSQVVNRSEDDAVLTIAFSGVPMTFSGNLGGTEPGEGNFNLVKTGTGDYGIDGSLTYTGSTTVAEGTLTLAVADLNDDATLSIEDGAVLNLTHGETDVVGALVIDGVTQPDGTYGATGSGAQFINDDAFAGTGVVQVGDVTQSPYESFEAANGIVGAGPSADSDGDGIPNGIEFVLGTDSDPTSPTSNSNADLPTSEVDDDDLIFVFRRTDDSIDADPFVEYGSDLVGWTRANDGDNGISITTVDDFYAAGIAQVTVRIPRTLATSDRLFARLRVDIP